MREYFHHESGLAPYLKTRAATIDPLLHGKSDHDLIHNEGISRSSNVGEGDAAGGSVMQRVSSFHMLLTSSTTPKPVPRQDAIPTTESKIPDNSHQSDITPTWRLKDRMKTVGVGLVMALNVGTDPPDVTKPNPCARLQCWMDPSSVSRAKAKEKIGERLEAQYGNWQQQKPQKTIKYRRALDPTVDDVRGLCLALRRHARNERILLHYNGHGVPRATSNGEIWVFDSHHTQYIPLCVTDLRQWMGKPSIVVLDCSCAGILMPFLTAPLDTTPDNSPPNKGNQTRADDMDSTAAHWIGGTIVLCPTASNEWLPMHPDYPADIFTSCLTTPIQMALRWFVRRNPQSMRGLNPDDIDLVPGKANDRKTPLGELNWIFTAVTDSIAWNVLPKPLFQRLFRQDLMVASMFRNFLLADRILRSLNCSPQSFPPLPPGVCDHPLWQAWDLSCETCLTGLMRDGIIGNPTTFAPVGETDVDDSHPSPLTTSNTVPAQLFSSISAPFFSEQLTAFEIWLEFASIHKNAPGHVQDPNESPEQLPVVLQVLLSQAHRVRALMLLRQFLDLGPWAVNLALSLGIFPYVMKLLQSPEYKQNLVGIWAKVLAFDPSCQMDLVKDGALPHFIHHLTWGLSRGTISQPIDPREAAEQRTMAAFILAITCRGYPQGQNECIRLNLHGTCCALLSSMDLQEKAERDHDYFTNMALAEQRTPSTFRVWLCLCLGTLVKDNTNVQNDAFAANVHRTLVKRMEHDDSPDVRAAACYGLGCLLGSSQISGSDMFAGSTLILQSQQLQQPSSTFLGGVEPMQTNGTPTRLLGDPTQNLVMLPQGFPGRLQPISGNTGGYGTPWNPHEAPSGVVEGALGGHNLQPIRVQSMQYHQGVPASHLPRLGTSMPLMGEGLLNSPLQQQMEGKFIVNQNNVSVVGSPTLSLSMDSRQVSPTVFDDQHRMLIDLEVVDALIRTARDASPLVRYEAAVSLACAVEKYLPAFLAVSEVMSLASNQAEGTGLPTLTRENKSTSRDGIDFPHGVDMDTLNRFAVAWKTIKDLKYRDPHPQVAAASSAIVSYVHEKILSRKIQLEPIAFQAHVSRSSKIGKRGNTMSASDHICPRVASSGGLYSAMNPPASDGPPHRLVSESKDLHTPLRRIASELGGSGTGHRDLRTHSTGGASIREEAQNATDTLLSVEYELPASELLTWKRAAFISIDDENTVADQAYDPLSARGAAIAYQGRRAVQIQWQSRKLADYYACINPLHAEKAAMQSSALLEADEGKETLAEEEMSRKKNTLRLKQTKAIKNEAQEMTSMLKFHPCEDLLVVCHGQDNVSLWNTTSGSRSETFANGNLKGSRMTSSCWINAMSNTLFALGSDDGSIRVWSGLSTKLDGTTPTLTSAFHALADMNPDVRGSGLVMDWQQFYGRLVAGGKSNCIQCWDLGAEKCLQTLQTQTEACVTSISTAGNERLPGAMPYAGIGPAIIIAGFSDGAIRTFDLRMHSSTSNTRRSEAQHYKEHRSWIVSTAFTAYGGNHEIVSGSVSGEIKVWDLRYSVSLRTHNVQRSPMTALALHPLIPLVATGSHAQFVKLFSLDGDTLEVIRYHEEMAGHRIGPVGCLAFHPHKPLLASGGTDGIVGIYAPKNPVTF